MSAKAAKAYANNDVHSGVIDSDPIELVVLVYERALDHLKLGKAALEQNEYGIEHFTKANDLIQKGLLACIDYSQGEDIAQNLAAIYEWTLREIIKGRVEKSPEKIQEVINVLTPLYEGWLGLSAKEPVHFSNPKNDHRSSAGSSLSAA
jgi:flagellar protein FliS